MSYRQKERERIAKLPKGFQQIDELVAKAGPTNYTVHYPWNHPCNEVPNCMAMLGDGSIMFKLEVIGDDFKLAINRAWRGKDDYDFLFAKYGIKEGDLLDYETLLKIIEESVTHIRRRSPILYDPDYFSNVAKDPHYYDQTA